MTVALKCACQSMTKKTFRSGLLREQVHERFQLRGLNLDRERVFDIAPRHILEEHYKEHSGKSFLPSLIDFMESGPVVVSVWRGPKGAIGTIRDIVGATDPTLAAPGTIRQEFGSSVQENVLHASDSVASAQREIKLWFR